MKVARGCISNNDIFPTVIGKMHNLSHCAEVYFISLIENDTKYGQTNKLLVVFHPCVAQHAK